jgi:hypothetical protein
MTITNTILRNDYVANGSSTVFSFTFIVLSETAGYTIQVITTDLIGAETVKTQGVDYTVQLNDNGLGTITFLTAPILNHKITLLSNVPNTQETDYIKSGTDKFPAESHEKALDKLTLISKQFLEKFNRIVSLPKNSTLSNIEFPINASNANQILAINNDGTNLTTKDLADIGLAPVSAYIKTLLDDATANEARTTLGVAIGSEVQAYNANLQALAGLVGASNKLPYFTGSGAMALQDRLATATNQGLTYLNNPITIANNATDPDNDIDFTAGNFEFSDGSGQAVLSALTKRLDASWTAGTNQGGLDTGTKANSTWYHCYAIYNPTSGISDAIFSTNATNPTLPAGYTKYALIESIKTNSSGNILPVYQIGDYISWKTKPKDITSGLSTSLTPHSISTPLGRNVMAKIRATLFTGGASTVNILSPLDNSLTPISSENDLVSQNYTTSIEKQVITDTSSQISIIASAAPVNSFTLFTFGWKKIK